MTEIKPDFAEYLATNEAFWLANNNPSRGRAIIVDLMHDNQWYVRLNCLTARYLQMLHGGRIIGIQHKWEAPFVDYRADDNRAIAYSFGVDEIIDLDNIALDTMDDPGVGVGSYAELADLPALAGAELRQRLLTLTVEGNEDFGWLAYDTFIRSERIATIERYTPELANALLEYARLQRLTRKIVDHYDAGYCVLGHVEYLPYAFFAQQTIKNSGTTCFLWPVVPGTLRLFDRLEDLRVNRSADFLENYESLVKPAAPYDSALMRRFVRGFRDRFAITRGYRHNNRATDTSLSRSNLADLFDLDKDKPFVCLFSQALSDAVHANGPMVFDDFGQWLLETMQFYLDNPTHNLLIKIHPRNRTYCQDDFVTRLARLADHSPNVRVIPNSFQNGDLASNAEVGSTVHGTPGYELVTQGLRTVISGTSRYSQLDIADEATTRDGYFSMLSERKELDPRAVEAGYQFAFAELNVFRCPTALVTTEHPRVQQANIYWRDEANRLSTFAIEDDPYFQAIRDMFEQDRRMFVRTGQLC